MAAIGAIAAALVVVPAAYAAPIAINGNPLTVYVDDHGQLQAVRAGNPSGFFFPSGGQTGDAGFFLAFPGATPEVYGFDGDAGPSGLIGYTPTPAMGDDVVTGTGTQADPLKLVRTYTAGARAQVTQTTTYVNGQGRFTVEWVVRNLTAAPLDFKALAAADFFFDGDDTGVGVFSPGPPRFVGGTNADTGNSGGFEEVTTGSPAWSGYEALPYGTGADAVWGKVAGAAATSTPTFDNTVDTGVEDNAGGVEWDATGVAPLTTRTFRLVIRTAVAAALQLTPASASSVQGTPASFAVHATNTDGAPYAGATLRYLFTGANPGSGSAVLNASGNASFSDPGTNAGTDGVVAYIDFNNNSVRDSTEPIATASAAFAAKPPPPAAGTADLSVRLSSSPSEPQPGKSLTFTALVRNAGPGTARAPVLTFTMPAGSTFRSAPAGCSRAGDTVTCNLADIPAGGSRSLAIVVVPQREGAQRASARVTSATGDSSTGNNGVTATAAAALPEPRSGRTLQAGAVSGRVLVKAKGSKRFARLRGDRLIKVGSIVDARDGRVRITADGGHGKRWSAVFFEGVFKLLQQKRPGSVVELRLVGRLERCGRPARARSSAVAVAAKHRKGRRLWGKGKGRFRTRGKRSAATVTGTTWLVADRCDRSTLTFVKQGVVKVRDFARKRTVTVRAGRRYVARP